MVSKYISHTDGNRANGENFFPSDLHIDNKQFLSLSEQQQPGVIVLQLALAPAVISTKFNYGYEVDTIKPGYLEVTKNGGKNWSSINEATPIKGDELHEFRVPVKLNDSVNFRASGLEQNKKLQLKTANVHYFAEPL
jgi:hypothetical protein